MKLGIAINVFDSEEFLRFNLPLLRPLAHHIVAVCQEKSWTGENYSGGYNECLRLFNLNLIDEIKTVKPTPRAFQTEVTKRNIGLNCLRDAGCTHYLIMDCDEFYKPEQVKNAMAHIEKNDYKASVAKMYTYFKDVQWCIGLDNYYVPFIGKIEANTALGQNKGFKFLCDPTRIPNVVNGVCEFNSEVLAMHHYSWVRCNEDSIMRKVNNSTAGKFTMFKIKKQYDEAKLGQVVPHYGKKLYLCENEFGIRW